MTSAPTRVIRARMRIGMDFGDEHTPTGATSTSEPNHEVDPEVDPRKANPHEKRRAERRRAG